MKNDHSPMADVKTVSEFRLPKFFDLVKIILEKKINASSLKSGT
jgi:hypothetical protein